MSGEGRSSIPMRCVAPRIAAPSPVASLDVPIRSRHRRATGFYTHPNVHLTAHISSTGSSTEARAEEILLGNIAAYRAVISSACMALSCATRVIDVISQRIFLAASATSRGLTGSLQQLILRNHISDRILCFGARPRLSGIQTIEQGEDLDREVCCRGGEEFVERSAPAASTLRGVGRRFCSRK